METNFVAKIGASIRDFQSKMREVDKQVREMATEATKPIGADIFDFIAKIQTAESLSEKMKQPIEKVIQAEMADFNRKIAQLQAKIASLESERISIPIEGRYDGREFERARNHTRSTFRGMSAEARAMQQEMSAAFRAESESMRGLNDEMIKVQHGYFKMAQGAKTYSGTNKQFMTEVAAMGAAHKSATDNMMKNNELMKMSMIQTAGTMLNMSTQASKISANYDRMANPMYKVNQAGLAIADSLNKIALSGNASVLALKMLGPNASMKSLMDMQNMINQGVMRYQSVLLAAAVTSILVYGALHKAAMKSNKGYAKSFNTMVASVKKAFEPMVEVFAMVMTKVYDFITAISKMVIKFNEAHPVLAKVLQGFLMLIPILTLILAPLAVGIGLFGGLAASMTANWAIIGPVVTGFLSMIGTVMLVSAAIVGLALVFNHLWKTNEGFRNAVISAWDAIKEKAVEVFGWLATFLAPIVQTLKGHFKTLSDAVKATFTGDFSKIGEIFKAIIPTIIAALVGGIPGLIIAASRFIPAIAQGITSNAGTLSATIAQVANSITTFLTTQLPIFIQEGVKIINGIVQGLVQALPAITGALVNLVTLIVPLITQMLPVLIGAGIQIVQALITGITQILPALLEAGISLITSLIGIIAQNIPLILNAGIQVVMTLINGIVQVLPQLIAAGLQLIEQLIQAVVTNIPKILDTGIKIVMTLIDGIMKILPELINTAVKLVTTILNALVENLPKILDAGVKILDSLIAGILKILPKLIDTALNLVTKIIDTFVKNLPKFIDSGVKILTALINGIVKILPNLIDTVIKLVTSILNTLVQNLPKIIDAGVKILTALINGIVKILPQLIQAAIKLVVEIVKAIVNNLPKIIEAGGKILTALKDGIIKLVGTLLSAAKTSVIDPLVKKFKEIDLKQVGKDIIQGLINGIGSMAGALWKKVHGIASSIKKTLAGALQVKSPSRWMRDMIGKNIVSGVIVGIERMQGSAVQTVSSLASSITDAFSPQLAIADVGISRTPLDAGLQMDEIKQQIKDELDVDLWIHQQEKARKQQGTNGEGAGDIVLEVDGYELARVQRQHLDNLNGTSLNMSYRSRGVRR